jgi:hypothetical protein
MSVRADLQQDKGWFIGERKVLQFTVKDTSGNDIDMTGVPLKWALRKTVPLQSHYRSLGGQELIVKETPLISVVGPLVEVEILESDYANVTKAGTYAHALRRMDDFNVLSEGEVQLLIAAAQ